MNFPTSSLIHPLISPFSSPNPNIHVFTENDCCSLPPLSPQHPDFEARPIPSPLLSPLGGPSPQLSPHQEEGVSNLMAGLQFENPDCDQTLLSHSQSIATLETQARRTEEILRQNNETIQELRQLLVFAAAVNKLKTQLPQELQHVCNTVDGALTTLQRCVGHLESRYFCTASGNLGKECPLYTWWRGLLTKNAHEQCLPTQKASLALDFVIAELFDLESFLSAVKDMFSNHKEAEEQHKALFSLRQGSKSIAEFNIQFNTLLYTVILLEESKCEVYEAAINPKIVKLGVQRGGWTELDTLVEKQRMAVKLSIDIIRVAQINQKKYQAPLPRIEFKRAPVPVIPVPLKSAATPMDLDSVLAELGFSYANWCRECTDRSLCFCCAKPFDKSHIKVRGCPSPKDKWLGKLEILRVWKSWGGVLREDQETGSSTDNKGMKRKSISEVNNKSPFKCRLVSGPAGRGILSPAPLLASVANVDAIVE
ncbi:hypothetical protein PCASD_04961 [Puccinia coronata f. sp. avenae]|uniref:Retrotransposon gag domain-containing protein n=1 Tax=Puccinia coronata f. sp. avenae TaxID=200324 RepID=A0A2N5VD43_9BASI|nr:hypothetical protein PCASD_04961 [Puccinia coronata f. sp. avenae]